MKNIYFYIKNPNVSCPHGAVISWIADTKVGPVSYLYLDNENKSFYDKAI